MTCPSFRYHPAIIAQAAATVSILSGGRFTLGVGSGERLNEHITGAPFPSAVAASGPPSVALAAELGDGLFATEPDRELFEAFLGAGGTGPRYAEVPLAWAPDADTAARAALETTRWAVTGWKVESELPNPVNFAAASTTVTTEDIKAQFACGPDVEHHLEKAQLFVDAGFDHLVLQNAGPDPAGYIEFFADELAKPVRALTPTTPS